MNKLNLNKIIIILIHGLIIWALCGATIAIGRSVTTMQLILKIHGIAAPIFAFGVSMLYYRKFNYTSPIWTAIIFLLVVIALDAGIVAPVFEKSYDMFRSILGTWVPFILIFLSTYFTGLLAKRKNSRE